MNSLKEPLKNFMKTVEYVYSSDDLLREPTSLL